MYRNIFARGQGLVLDPSFSSQWRAHIRMNVSHKSCYLRLSAKMERADTVLHPDKSDVNIFYSKYLGHRSYEKQSTF